MSWFDSFRRPPAEPLPALTRGRALACIPRKNSMVREQRQENGLIRLTYPMAARPFIGGLARKLGKNTRPTLKRLDLDEMGTFVWERIDGHRPVQGLVDEFRAVYGVHSREAEVAMSTFLRDLGRRGLIGMDEAQPGRDI